jgi:hypothetical protein
MGKCDCRVEYAWKGICDSKFPSLKSQYLPKDDAYIIFRFKYGVHYPWYVGRRLNVCKPKNRFQNFGYVIEVKHPQLF